MCPVPHPAVGRKSSKGEKESQKQELKEIWTEKAFLWKFPW